MPGHTQPLGEPGRGIATILEMVHHTRLHTSVAPASLMHQALALAAHHTLHRRAFGRTLIEQPLMRQVLCDLALESEAATVLAFRLARAFDASGRNPREQRFARVTVPVVKYWNNKRAPAMVAECMECLGGSGYVEESLLPRLYREAPLNGIWEGSANVMCLDFLRALHRDPEAHSLLLDELALARGYHPKLDAATKRVTKALAQAREESARALTGEVAVTLAASLLAQQAPEAVAIAYIRSRLGECVQRCYGDLPPSLNLQPILDRVSL
jgi:putative acyl-CoA dehydrogenase